MINTMNYVMGPKVNNFLKDHERTKYVYFLVNFWDIHNKFVLCKSVDRHVDPSIIQQLIAEKYITDEIIIEQDDTLHKHRFEFEYFHEEKYDENEEISERSFLALCFRHKDVI